METKTIVLKRETKETQIQVKLNLNKPGEVSLNTSLPFFDHMLHAMAFHGGFSLSIEAKGDIEVDYHHLVEDTGIVLGQAFHEHFIKSGGVARYSQTTIPMDEALAEVIIDVCNRPFLVYNVDFPQNYSGVFDMSLFKEFFIAFINNAKINLHIQSRYGDNSHHISEAIFKAFGKSLKKAYTSIEGDEKLMSTKGKI